MIKRLLAWCLCCIMFVLVGCTRQTAEQTADKTHNTTQSGTQGVIQTTAETTSQTTAKIATQTTIYALGDSLTAGYQLPLQDSYPSQLQRLLQNQGYKTNVVNGGHSGDTSQQLLQRLDRTIAEANPGDIVILVIGANDGLQSLDLNQLEQNLRAIIEQLQQKQLRIVLGGMQLPTSQGETYRQEFASLYPQLAAEYDLFLLPFFLEGVAVDPTYNLADGIHPNKQGYEIIASNLLSFLQQEGLLSQ